MLGDLLLKSQFLVALQKWVLELTHILLTGSRFIHQLFAVIKGKVTLVYQVVCIVENGAIGVWVIAMCQNFHHKIGFIQSLMVQEGAPNLNVTLKGYPKKFWGLFGKVAHKTQQITQFHPKRGGLSLT